MEKVRCEELQQVTMQFAEIVKATRKYLRDIKEALERENKEEAERLAVEVLEDFKGRALVLHELIYGEKKELRKTKAVTCSRWNEEWEVYMIILKVYIPDDLQTKIWYILECLREGLLNYAEREAKWGYLCFSNVVLRMYEYITGGYAESIYRD